VLLLSSAECWRILGAGCCVDCAADRRREVGSLLRCGVPEAVARSNRYALRPRFAANFLGFPLSGVSNSDVVSFDVAGAGATTVIVSTPTYIQALSAILAGPSAQNFALVPCFHAPHSTPFAAISELAYWSCRHQQAHRGVLPAVACSHEQRRVSLPPFAIVCRCQSDSRLSFRPFLPLFHPWPRELLNSYCFRPSVCRLLSQPFQDEQFKYSKVALLLTSPVGLIQHTACALKCQSKISRLWSAWCCSWGSVLCCL
jgi:hypothetical protein